MLSSPSGRGVLRGPEGGARVEGYGGPEVRELLLEELVAAQDVRGSLDNGGPFGGEAGHHEGGAAPEVGGLHDRPLQRARAAHEGAVAAEEVYPGVHAVQLLCDLQAVLVDVLRDYGGPRG